VKGAIKILKGIEFRADPEISATTKADTGDCTEEEHRRLQDEVNERCKDVKRACEKGMRCEETKSKMRRNEKCAQARERINKKCFKGGDAGHRRAAQEARRAQENCRQLIRENCK
jgi:type VI secretion system secreted protein VgrG